MIKENSRRTVMAGLMLAMGIILPFVTSHGWGLPLGQILLPMHIPVLLSGFFCGPLTGSITGFILPYLNSAVSGMPTLFPNGVIMSFELLGYGLSAGLIHKLFKNKNTLPVLYVCLVTSLIFGRAIYALTANILFFFVPGMKYLSVISAAVKGIPGIAIQLVILPPIVKAASKILRAPETVLKKAIKLIDEKKATCVVVRDGKIISCESPVGISHLLDLYDKGILKDSYVADTVIGKAAAMIFSLAGVKGCYGMTLSSLGAKWLQENNIPYSYKEKAEIIINRKGDGMCPMEETVLEITDSERAIELLKKKVKLLKEASRKE